MSDVATGSVADLGRLVGRDCRARGLEGARPSARARTAQGRPGPAARATGERPRRDHGHRLRDTAGARARDRHAHRRGRGTARGGGAAADGGRASIAKPSGRLRNRLAAAVRRVADDAARGPRLPVHLGPEGERRKRNAMRWTICIDAATRRTGGTVMSVARSRASSSSRRSRCRSISNQFPRKRTSTSVSASFRVSCAQWLARLRLLEACRSPTWCRTHNCCRPSRSASSTSTGRWTDALVQGALSVGTVNSADRAQLEQLHRQIRDEIDEEERPCAAARRGERAEGTGRHDHRLPASIARGVGLARHARPCLSARGRRRQRDHPRDASGSDQAAPPRAAGARRSCSRCSTACRRSSISRSRARGCSSASSSRQAAASNQFSACVAARDALTSETRRRRTHACPCPSAPAPPACSTCGAPGRSS